MKFYISPIVFKKFRNFEICIKKTNSITAFYKGVMNEYSGLCFAGA
jgi:hypothetical protein